MKKTMNITLALLIVSLQSAIYSCNQCYDYPKKKKLRIETMEKVDCNCNCEQQPHSSHDEKYICLACGHRAIPKNITTNQRPEPTIKTPKLLQHLQLKKAQSQILKAEILEVEKELADDIIDF